VAANVDGYARDLSGNVIGVIVRVPQGAVTGCIIIITPTCQVVICVPCTINKTQPPCPIFLGYSTSQVRADDFFSIFGYNFDEVSQVLFTSATGGTLRGAFSPLPGGNGLSVKVPVSAISGKIVIVTRGGCQLELPYIIIILVTPNCPTINRGSFPTTANINETFTVTGSGLGSGGIKVLFNSASGVPVEGFVTPVSDTQLRVTVPPNAITGPVIIIVGNGCNIIIIEIVAIGGSPSTCPIFKGVDKQEAAEGETLTITGSNFTNRIDRLLFNSATGASLSVQPAVVSDTQLNVIVPRGAVTSPIIIIPRGTCSYLQTPIIVIKVPTGNACPAVTSINPASGKVGDSVTINGTNLSGITSVIFSSNVIAPATANASGTQLTTTVPQDAVSGPLSIRKQGCPDAITQPFTVQQASCVSVSIDNNLTASAGGTLTVPIRVSDLTGKNVTGYVFELSFNPAVLQFQSVETANTRSSGLQPVINSNVAGKISVAVAATQALSGPGVLLNLKFSVIGRNSDFSDLTWSRFQFSDPCATTTNGRVTVTGSGSLSGTVTYYTSSASAPKAVASVTLTAAGAPPVTATTSRDGKYQLTNLGNGAYTVTPTKTGEVNGIGPKGATLILQSLVNLVTLTDEQKLAADVNDDDKVDTRDATLILGYIVSLPNTGNVGTWKFKPPNRPYSSITSDLINQDYMAVLVGDVNGEWKPESGPIAAPLTAARFGGTRAATATIKVTLPQATGDEGSSVTLPLTVSDLTGQNVQGYQFTLSYDAAVLQLDGDGVSKSDTLSKDMFIVSNTGTAGQIRVAAAGFNALAGAGPLLNFKFKVVGNAGATTALTLANFAFDGAQSADITNGSFSISRAAPVLTSLSPTSIVAGSQDFTLTLNGTNFVNGSTVRWNGANRSTTFVSTTQLTAAIPANDVASPSSASVTVFNPGSSGGVSNALSFVINSAVACVSAASFGATELATDSIIAAFGANLATQTLSAAGAPLPTTLAGTTVRVRDSLGTERLAQLFFVSANQVNYLMPAGTAPGAAMVTITNSNGKASVGTTQIAMIAPSLFTANANGQGVAAAVALRVKANGTQSFESVARFDTTVGRFVATPIDLGPEGEQVFLILFGTGFRNRSSLANVTALIGGASADVSFAGAQGDLAGLDQANVRLPRSLIGRGEVDIALIVNSKTANTVKVAIR
jgi:uncharacterized protein (TIGR03437 family)